jgi:hypothetical protein
MMGLG